MPKSRPVESDPIHGRRFAYIQAGLAGTIAFLPYLYGLLLAPVGQAYLGYQYNTDDHMVYSAWMRQAADGQFFFDNRFALDQQPGLTVHVYFFVLGLVGKLLGLALAANLAKAGFSVLFVLLLYRLLVRVSPNVFFVKLALSLAVVGGGLGFLMWHRFGEAIVARDIGPVGAILNQRLPIDVWQPEAFVFPSLLTNGLFMVSLCLIVGFFLCVLQAQDSWRSVPAGFVCMAVLMNIHSYDVLLVALVLIALLGASLASKTLSLLWLGRTAVMTLGAIGPALWFLHVYRNDSVFQARAATDTFSPNFRQVLFGILLMAGLAVYGLMRGTDEDDANRRRKFAAIGVGFGLLIMFALAGQAYEGYWMALPAWILSFAIAALLVGLLATANPAWNLVVAWAAVSVVAIYFPALFQRKLGMGMAIPWAVLAAVGIWQATRNVDRGMRNLASVLAILLLGGSSIRWFLREGEYIRDDVSRTTLHPVFLRPDIDAILNKLDRAPGRKIVLAMPGISSPAADENGQAIPDKFLTPYLPDLNAIASGLTGAYSYAGHWSETPEYLKRRSGATSFFLASTDDATRHEMLSRLGITHVIAPVPEAFPEFYSLTSFELADVSGLGAIVYEGSQFRLIEIPR